MFYFTVAYSAFVGFGGFVLRNPGPENPCGENTLKVRKLVDQTVVFLPRLEIYTAIRQFFLCFSCERRVSCNCRRWCSFASQLDLSTGNIPATTGSDDGMSSWNNPRALNPKRRKSGPLQNDTEGPDELEDRVKDSQDEGSGFLQDSSDGVGPAVVDLSIETRQGDENGHYRWGRTSEILAEQESERITNKSVFPRAIRLSSNSSKGKQSQPFPTKDSRESSPESLGKETGDVSNSHELQELTGETVASDVHAFMRFPNKELSIEPRGTPLALRLRELVQGPGSSACLPQPQFRVLERIGETSDSDVHALARFRNSEFSLESEGIPLALRLQELIQQAPATAPSTSVPHPQSEGKQVDRKKSASGLTDYWSAIEDDIVENFDTHGKKSASSTKNDWSAIEDDIVENFDTYGKKSASSTKIDRSAIEDDILESFHSSGEFQTKFLEKSASGVPAISTYWLWERFQDALESAPPIDTIPTSTDHVNSNQAPSGFSERLQNALRKLKSQQAHFQKSLTSHESLHGISRCLVVLISGKRLEAQLTTCQCKILQAPPEWNVCSHAAAIAVENSNRLPIIEVIFSSKMSGDLEFEVGSVVRVHPPWYEVHGGGKFAKIILGTYFCEMVE